MSHLYPQHEMAVGVLQLLLPVLQLLGPLLLPLQLVDVVHGRLQDGALVPPHVSEHTHTHTHTAILESNAFRTNPAEHVRGYTLNHDSCKVLLII